VASYRALALDLAADPARRAALRDRLLGQRTTSPLFDGVAFARDIEALFERMWARATDGKAPEHLPALTGA
jgi:predicted O-linked N-acetylglucosamine transferase (SPINDLY family)